MRKNYKRDIEQAATVIKVARIMGVSKRYVQMVRSGERRNDAILACYMEIQEQQELIENKLLKSVKELIPFPES